MEILVRSLVAFVFLWLVIRVVGRRELGQLSAFELVLLIVMGDLIQQGVTQEDYSLTGAVITVSTFAMLSIALSYVSWRFPRARPLLDGRPMILLRDGEPDEETLRHERIPVTELLEAARQEGIRDLSEVELVVLEPNGAYSFFERQSSSGSGGEQHHPAE